MSAATVTDFDDVRAQIDALHSEAEHLAGMSRVYDDPARAARLRAQASAKVRQAARLREQIGGE